MMITIPNLDNVNLKKLESILNADFEPIEILCEIEDNQKALDALILYKRKLQISEVE